MPRKVKILLVDDQRSQLVALAAILSDLGEVVAATSGREALRCLLTQSFAVVLLDVNMPDMDGFETAALIRQRKSCEDVPIIFITAYPDEIQIARGYSLGAVDYILSPVVPEVLRSKVRIFVELYRKTAKIRRQAERLRRRTAQLGTLTSQLIQVEERERARMAQVLHDHVQQLLAAASMRVEIVRQQAGDSELAAMLGEVDELLGQSIAAARSLSVELHPPILDSGGLVPALQWLARHMEKSCRLKVELEAESVPELGAAPRVFLFDAIRELLLNVVKHAGVDQVWVRLAEASPRVLEAVVEDHGIGFDAESTDSDRTIEHSGLRNIREKLKGLDGSLIVETASRKGARIVLRLPLAPSPAEAQLRRPEEGPGLPADASNGGPIRVLLADDHEILRKGLRSLLQCHTDIEVIGEAADGEEAVELARRLSPEVVIMDLSMPRLDGIQATRAIVGASPWVRVIGLSMKDGEDTVAAMRRAGAFDHVAKGDPPEGLLSVIRRSVRREKTGKSS